MSVPTTYVRYVYSGSAVFAYGTIGLIDALNITHADQLVVELNGTALTFSTDYTIDEGAEEVTVTTTLTTGDIILIKRETKNDEAYVDFANNAAIDADDLDANNFQLLYLIQELLSQTGDAITLSLGMVPPCWDAENYRICNLGSATASTDAVNYGQVLALIAGGDVADIGEGLYAEANGDGSTTAFVPQTSGGDYFPTTDIAASKIFVTIDGIIQRPGVDYTYTLNGSNRPQVDFIIGAPPTGTGNIQFRVIPGVVTTTYAAATLDGDVIINGTLDGDALVDGSVSGTKLEDGTVTLAKLTAGSGVDKRFVVFNTSGVGTARTITNADVTHTGASGRTDITNSQITEVVTSATAIHTTPYTYTNSGSTTLFLCASITTFQGGGSVTMTPDGGSAVVMGTWTNSGGSVNNPSFSFPVPPDATVTFTGSGSSDSLRRLTVVEY